MILSLSKFTEVFRKHSTVVFLASTEERILVKHHPETQASPVGVSCPAVRKPPLSLASLLHRRLVFVKTYDNVHEQVSTTPDIVTVYPDRNDTWR